MLLSREGILGDQRDIINSPKLIAETDEVNKNKINIESLSTVELPLRNPNIIKDKVEQMKSPKKKKNASPMIDKRNVIKYARMIKDSQPKQAVKNQMIKDKFCGQSSLNYYYNRAIKESETVTSEIKHEGPSTVTIIREPELSDRQKIDALYASTHTEIPVHFCKILVTWEQDLDEADIVFRGNLMNVNYDHKELIKAYHYSQGARD